MSNSPAKDISVVLCKYSLLSSDKFRLFPPLGGGGGGGVGAGYFTSSTNPVDTISFVSSSLVVVGLVNAIIYNSEVLPNLYGNTLHVVASELFVNVSPPEKLARFPPATMG